MKFAVLLTIGLTFAVPVLSEAQQEPAQEQLSADILVGVYLCQGVNPDGTAYEGIAEITKLDNTFRVLWTLGNQSQVLGVGILSNGVFAVSYWGGAPAIVVYKIDGNRLVGEWTIGGKEGQMYSETLTKLDELVLPSVPQEPAEHLTPQPKPKSTPVGLSV